MVSPPSSCPKCGRRLGALDLVPVFSYILLVGKCRHCGEKISPRYLLIELVTGFLFLLMYLHTGLIPQLLNYLLLSAVLVVVAAIDLDHYRIPDKVLITGAALQLVLNFFTHQIGFLDAFYGFAAGGFLVFLIAMVKPDGMGGGDIKLTATLGLFLGWQKILLAFFLACFLGAAVGLVMIAVKRKNLKEAVPFGPFLAVAGISSLLWGQQVLHRYLELFWR